MYSDTVAKCPTASVIDVSLHDFGVSSCHWPVASRYNFVGSGKKDSTFTSTDQSADFITFPGLFFAVGGPRSSNAGKAIRIPKR